MKFQAPANFRDVSIGTAGSQKKSDLRFSPYDLVKFAVFDKEVGRVRVELQILLYSYGRTADCSMNFNQPQMLDHVLQKTDVTSLPNIFERLSPELRALLLKVMTPDAVYNMLAFVCGAYRARSSL